MAAHGHGHAHGHDHTTLDRDLVTHRRAVKAVWISAAGLGATALFQFAVVAISGSAGLFADALHNIGDVAGTASLLIAFSLSRRRASDEFPYGWRRAEDLSGLLIVLAILVSAVLAGWDSVAALLGGGHEVTNIGWALAAAVGGIVGNEAVAQYKIRVGREIDSVPLIADGQHAPRRRLGLGGRGGRSRRRRARFSAGRPPRGARDHREHPVDPVAHRR